MAYLLIAADYTQIELRVLAALADSKAMLAAFEWGDDVHLLTAMTRFNVSAEKVTKSMRNFAKRTNFGIPYGLTARGMVEGARTEAMNDELDDEVRAELAQVTLGSCGQFIAAFHQTYDGIGEFMEYMKQQAREKGYVKTFYGRVRHIPAIRARNRRDREHGEKQAINLPITGTAADILKLAIPRVRQAYRDGRMEARLVLTVHDELTTRAPEGEVDEVVRIKQEIMPFVAPEIKVAFPIDVKVGPSLALLEAA